MTIYPMEFHRRLEQKWARRIDQISSPGAGAVHHINCVLTRRGKKALRFDHLVGGVEYGAQTLCIVIPPNSLRD
jgi:hypothetical protein